MNRTLKLIAVLFFSMKMLGVHAQEGNEFSMENWTIQNTHKKMSNSEYKLLAETYYINLDSTDIKHFFSINGLTDSLFEQYVVNNERLVEEYFFDLISFYVKTENDLLNFDAVFLKALSQMRDDYNNIIEEFGSVESYQSKITVALDTAITSDTAIVFTPGVPCTNMGFEQNSFNGWFGRYGENCGIGYCMYLATNGFSTGGANPRHSIVTAGNDPYAPNLSMVAPGGGSYSMRLGNSNDGHDADRISQTFLVTDPIFKYSYAAVLEDPAHVYNEQPYFALRIFDSLGSVIPCSKHRIVSGDIIPGFEEALPGTGIFWKDWSIGAVDLSAYVGQNVTVQFTAADCELGQHFGYAYIDASCEDLELEVSPWVVCNNSCPTITAPPGVYQYYWPHSGDTTQTVEVCTPGTYSCELTFKPGCSITIDTTITTPPVISLTADYTVNDGCVGEVSNFIDQSTILGDSIVNYYWDIDGDGTTDYTSQNPNHTYTDQYVQPYNPILIVESAGGCTDTISYPINVNNLLVNATGDTTMCNGDCADLSAEVYELISYPPLTTFNNTNYVTISGAQYSSSINVSGLNFANISPGDIESVCLNINYSFTPGLTIELTCPGGTTLLLSSGNGGVGSNYTGTCFTSSAVTSVTTGVAPLTGNFIPEGGSLDQFAGCSANGTWTLTIDSYLSAVGNLLDWSITFNTLDIDTIPSTNYTWTPTTAMTGSNTLTPTVCPTTTTTYSLTGTSGGCAVTEDVTVSVAPCGSLFVNPIGDTICNGEIATIDAIPTGAYPPFIYTWTGALVGPGPHLVNPVTTTSYNVSIVDSLNNSYDTIVWVYVNDPAQLTTVNTDETCFGACDGNVDLSSIGNGPFSFSWNDPINSITEDLSGLCQGNYTVIVTDANGCVDSTNVAIGSPTQLLVNALSDTIICTGATAVLTSQVSGGTAPYTYTWDNGVATQQISVTPTVSAQYCVIVQDTNGCTSQPSCVNVQVHPELSVIALSDQTICEGENASISASASGGNGGPYSYVWDQGLGAGAVQVVSPISTTTYTVTASDGCETPDTTANVTITLVPTPSILFKGDKLSGCLPLTVNFTSFDVPVGSQCTWNFGDGGTSNDCNTTSYTFNQAGCWDVTLSIITPEGCAASVTFTDYICVYDYPFAAFTLSPSTISLIEPLVEFKNLSLDANFTTGPNNYEWNISDGYTSTAFEFNHNFSGNQNTEGYTACLIATTPEGCADSVCHSIMVSEDLIFYVPNTFTPDGDAYNNTFYPVFTSGFDPQDYHLLIFNRWGEIVFESYDSEVGWDGTYGGKLVADNVFTWTIEFGNNKNDKRERVNGHVTILR